MFFDGPTHLIIIYLKFKIYLLKMLIKRGQYMHPTKTEFYEKYAHYNANGILLECFGNFKILENESAVELNTIIMDFLKTKAKFKN